MSNNDIESGLRKLATRLNAVFDKNAFEQNLKLIADNAKQAALNFEQYLKELKK